MCSMGKRPDFINQHGIPDIPISGKASAILLDSCNSGPRSESAMLIVWANTIVLKLIDSWPFRTARSRQAAMVLHKLVETRDESYLLTALVTCHPGSDLGYRWRRHDAILTRFIADVSSVTQSLIHLTVKGCQLAFSLVQNHR